MKPENKLMAVYTALMICTVSVTGCGMIRHKSANKKAKAPAPTGTSGPTGTTGNTGSSAPTGGTGASSNPSTLKTNSTGNAGAGSGNIGATGSTGSSGAIAASGAGNAGGGSAGGAAGSLTTTNPDASNSSLSGTYTGCNPSGSGSVALTYLFNNGVYSLNTKRYVAADCTGAMVDPCGESNESGTYTNQAGVDGMLVNFVMSGSEVFTQDSLANADDQKCSPKAATSESAMYTLDAGTLVIGARAGSAASADLSSTSILKAPGMPATTAPPDGGDIAASY